MSKLPSRFLLIAALFLLPAFAPAAVITTGCANTNVSCTLLELTQGATIQTNSLVFGDFTRYRLLGFQGALYPNISNIDVYGLDDGGLDPGPGLLFDLNGQWDVSGIGLIDIATTFNVSTAANPIKDSSVELGPGAYASGAGSESGAEDYLFEFAGGPPIYRLVADIRPSDGYDVRYVETDFVPLSSVHGMLSFRVNGGGSGEAYLDQFTLRFSQVEAFDVVPEPASLTLFAFGSLALLLLGKRRAC
jgi:hypothetical protein